MAYAAVAGRNRRSRFGIAMLLIALAGCSAEPRRTADSSPAARAAAAAIHQVGAPYQYGGAGPNGFDCSGLVYYSFRKAGVRVPRTSADQFHAARPVPLDDARPGDLVFFRLENKVSHVGIYLGNRRFVHAPSHGGSVEVESLENRYYERHLVRAGRLDL